MQAPSAKVKVVPEVHSEVKEGMHVHRFLISLLHYTISNLLLKFRLWLFRLALCTFSGLIYIVKQCVDND